MFIKRFRQLLTNIREWRPWWLLLPFLLIGVIGNNDLQLSFELLPFALSLWAAALYGKRSFPVLWLAAFLSVLVSVDGLRFELNGGR